MPPEKTQIQTNQPLHWYICTSKWIRLDVAPLLTVSQLMLIPKYDCFTDCVKKVKQHIAFCMFPKAYEHCTWWAEKLRGSLVLGDSHGQLYKQCVNQQSHIMKCPWARLWIPTLHTHAKSLNKILLQKCAKRNPVMKSSDSSDEHPSGRHADPVFAQAARQPGRHFITVEEEKTHQKKKKRWWERNAADTHLQCSGQEGKQTITRSRCLLMDKAASAKTACQPSK